MIVLLQWRPGQSPWRPLHFHEFLLIKLNHCYRDLVRSSIMPSFFFLGSFQTLAKVIFAPPKSLHVYPCYDHIWNISMMTSSHGNIFRLTDPLCGEFTGPGEFPTQGPVTRSFDVFFDLRLNKRLSKQPWGWWFETPAWSLWHHQCNVCDNYSCTHVIFPLQTSIQ